MTPRVWLGVVSLLLVFVGESFAPPPRRVREPLMGMWKVVKAEFNGQDVRTLEDAQVRFFDMGITVFAKGKEVFGADYVLRSQEGANAIDVTTLTRPNPAFPLPFHGKDEMSKGYFVLTPQTSAGQVKKLEICLPAPDAARPKNLQSPPGKEILHLVLIPAQRPR